MRGMRFLQQCQRGNIAVQGCKVDCGRLRGVAKLTHDNSGFRYRTRDLLPGDISFFLASTSNATYTLVWKHRGTVDVQLVLDCDVVSKHRNVLNPSLRKSAPSIRA